MAKPLPPKYWPGELGLPLLYTRFDAVICFYLGQTAAHLRNIFEVCIRRAMQVLFFDEFDAIGKSATA
ncbi:MAG: AAA family ATPase [Caldilineaceae bacterium]